MKVKNLIQALKGMDPEAEVCLECRGTNNTQYVVQYELIPTFRDPYPIVYIADSLLAVEDSYKHSDIQFIKQKEYFEAWSPRR